MLQVNRVGPYEEDLQEKWKVLRLMCWWTVFHCATQLKHTLFQNGVFEWNGTMENSQTNILVWSIVGCTEGLTTREMESFNSNVLVNCFSLCHSTQTHCFKNYSFWNDVFEWSGTMENSGINVGGVRCWEGVCVCVCVCEWESERERESEEEEKKKKN
jgi:hypothetical protein